MQEPTIEQKRAALFGVTAVHASFGDVELAQMTLRGERARGREGVSEQQQEEVERRGSGMREGGGRMAGEDGDRQEGVAGWPRGLGGKGRGPRGGGLAA